MEWQNNGSTIWICDCFGFPAMTLVVGISESSLVELKYQYLELNSLGYRSRSHEDSPHR